MEVDAQPAAGPADGFAEEPAAPQQFALNILQIIRTAQQQNGLKHGDYGRYRQYCARRLRSLYKALKFLHGKSRYTKKKLDAGMINDVRYLHIPLVSAERAWSYAMELKKEAEAQPASSARKRLHSVRRLGKAAFWASELSRFAAERCDMRSALEAEAYSSWMGGNLLMEKESDWEGALARYARAQKLFSELAKVGDLDSQSLCNSMVEEIGPSIRYCTYQISRAGGAAPDPQQLLELGGNGAGHPVQDMLQSKLAALQAEAQSAQAASTSSVEWRGQKHPVRHEAVRLPLHTAAELAAQIDSSMEVDGQDGDAVAGAADAAAPGGVEAKLALYDKLVNAYSSARSAVRAAIKAGSSSADGDSSGGGGAELAALEVAIRGLQLERSLQKGQLALDDATARFEANQARLAAGQKAKDSRASKPEDLVRLHDSLLHYTEELSELATALGGRSGEALSDACAARSAVYVAGRCLCVGHAYLAGDKYGEAGALFERAQQRVAEAEEKLQELPRGEPLVAEATPTLQAIKAKAAAYRLVALAEAAAESATTTNEAAKGISTLGLSSTAGAAAGQRYLADHLEEWEAFGGGPGGKGARIYASPYPPQAAPLRPIMLDTAASHLKYPALEHRVRKSATAGAKSTFSRLFGGWGTTK